MRSYAVEYYIGSFVGNQCTVVHFTHQAVHDAYMEKTGSHCRSSIRCLNGGSSCTCLSIYNNVPNHWFFYFVWVYTFELGLPSFARLCAQNHMSKLYAHNHTPKTRRPKPNHTPKTIRPKPCAQNHAPKTLGPKAICPKPNPTPNTIRPKPYAQKPYAQSQTIRPKPYTQNHTHKTIRPKPYAQKHTPKIICPKPYAQKPYAQSQTLRPKPYAQSHTPKRVT